MAKFVFGDVVWRKRKFFASLVRLGGEPRTSFTIDQEEPDVACLSRQKILHCVNCTTSAKTLRSSAGHLFYGIFPQYVTSTENFLKIFETKSEMSIVSPLSMIWDLMSSDILLLKWRLQ